MHPELFLLVGSAATIAFVHTLLGPDHYLPFVAMARARGWSERKTLRVTLWCGLGHLLGSVGLGLVGIYFGARLAQLEWIEAVRGETAAWLLVGFGLAYAVWGLRRAWRKRPHTHLHHHGKMAHSHAHGHDTAHAHVHAEPGRRLTPWVIFIIFVLGPCEPLIPLLMYPAATHSIAGVLWVTAVFGLVTVLTMLAAVALSMRGLGQLKLGRLQRFDHALAGVAVFTCGLAMVFLGV